MPKEKRGPKPKRYAIHGSLMTVRRFAQMLHIPLSTAYYHLQVCGGDMEAAWARAEATRTRQAEIRIARILRGEAE